MSRNVIRTASLSLDDIGRIVDLFGTIANAHRRLGLEAIVPYQHFYRAMHFQSITPKHKEEIEGAWERWQFLFLAGYVPPSCDLTVNTMNRDEVPDWHPGEVMT
jgi:hypothetical protein